MILDRVLALTDSYFSIVNACSFIELFHVLADSDNVFV